LTRVRDSRAAAVLLVASIFGVALSLAACGGSDALREGAPPTDPVAEASAEELFATGMASASGGDLVRAEQYLAAAGARGYDETKIIGQLVRVCVAASRLRQALLYAQPYLRTHPEDWRLRFVVATIHLGLESVADARRELARVVLAAPEVPEPHFALASLLRERLHDDAAARPHFERYLVLAPTGAHADEARVALDTPLPPPTELGPMPATSAPTSGTSGGNVPASDVTSVRLSTTPRSASGPATPTSPPLPAPSRTPTRLPRRTSESTPTATGTP